MITLEGYIAKRKKEDRLNEFDLGARSQNMKLCVDYIFEYFNNYLNMSEADEKTILHEEKLDRFRKQLRMYEPEIREWIVGIYGKYGRHIHKHISNILKLEDLFLLYNEDNEFRSVSYDCYSKLIKKFPFLKGQTEILFLLIKDYHRVISEENYSYGIPSISEEITNWIEKTWLKYQVNLVAFSSTWIDKFCDNEGLWPSTHKKKVLDSWRSYDYDYKQKSNLFNLDSLYRKMPKKVFIKGKKQEFEIILMYCWLHEIESDDDYWKEYLDAVLPKLKG